MALVTNQGPGIGRWVDRPLVWSSDLCPAMGWLLDFKVSWEGSVCSSVICPGALEQTFSSSAAHLFRPLPCA